MDDDTDLTEITDMTSLRVDAVKGAANGATFLLVKALHDPTAAAEMADAVAKAEESTAAQDDLPDSAFAYIEPGGTKDADGKTRPRSLRHFPISDAAHVRNALARADQSPFGDKALPKIRAAAKKFGVDLAKATTTGVTAETGLHGNPLLTDVAATPGALAVDNDIDVVPEADIKDDEDLDNPNMAKVSGGLYTTEPRALVAKAEADTPGSPAWEAQDAALLHQAATALAAISNQLEEACDREEAEVMAGDTADLSDVYDLGDAMCCLQQALGIVSRLVYTEAAETTDTDPTGMAKAGKRLSAKSEQSIKETIATLTALLAGDGATVASNAADDAASSTPADGGPVAKGAAGTDPEEDLDMNEADLTKMLDDRDAKLTASVTAGVADLIKGLVPGTAQVTDTTTATPVVATTDTTDQSDLVKGLAAAFKEAVTPLEERLAKMEAAPRRGVGPLAMVPRGGGQGDVGNMIKSLVEQADTATDPHVAAAKRAEASMLNLSRGYATGKVFDTLA